MSIDTIRAALDACYQGNAYERYLAREALGSQAEAYIKRLLDEIDSLIAIIRDLDERTTHDDPSQDTELEDALLEVARLRRALDMERRTTAVYLQRAASSVRHAHKQERVRHRIIRTKLPF